jgi:hypothetical protein
MILISPILLKGRKEKQQGFGKKPGRGVGFESKSFRENAEQS